MLRNIVALGCSWLVGHLKLPLSWCTGPSSSAWGPGLFLLVQASEPFVGLHELSGVEAPQKTLVTGRMFLSDWDFGMVQIRAPRHLS